MHYYQLQILKKLMYNKEQRFSDMQIQDLTSKHFNYHLKELIIQGFVKKDIKASKYTLTNEGKDYVGKVDEANMHLEKQPKISVALFPERVGKDGKIDYLVNRRLKEPYYGKVGGFTGKVRFGETFEETAQRELMEEAGLTAKFQLAKIIRKMAFVTPDDSKKHSKASKENPHPEIVQDNIFVIFLATEVKGELIKTIADQENFWFPYEELPKRDDLFNTYLTFLDFARTSKMKSVEHIVEAEGF